MKGVNQIKQLIQINNLYYKVICLIVINLFLQVSSIKIKLNDRKNVKFNVYDNDTVDEFFKYKKDSDICDCSSKFIYYEFADRNETNFTMEIKEDEKIEKIFVKTSNKRINTNFSFNLVETIPVNESNIKDKVYSLNVQHTCDNTIVKESNYWGVVEVELYRSLESMEKIKFKFIKFCEPPETMGSILTTIILFTMSTIFVAISTYSEISLELTDIKQEGEIKQWHAIILIISGSLILILIFYFVEFINISFTILITFQISLAYYLCLKTFYEFLGFNTNKKFNFLNKKLAVFKMMKLELYSLILIIITIITVLVYLTTKHWILNNIFGFCLVFTILSLFHIKSFKICAILLISAFMYDVFWVYLSPLLFKKNVMVVAATSLNLPIKLEMPIFFESHPLKSCMFLGLGDLVLPGFVLKFCHRFDFLKNTNVYYITSLILYILALTLSGIAIAIMKYPQPVLFYMCPVLLSGIWIISYKRKETEIWNAHLLEENLHIIFDNVDHHQVVDVVESTAHNSYNMTRISENFHELGNTNDLSFTETVDSNSTD